MKPLQIQPDNAVRLKSWVLTEVQRRLNFYRKAMELRHGLRSIRFGRNVINLPPLISELVPQQMAPRISLAYEMGGVVVGAVASKRPRVQVLPSGEGDKDSAALRQKFLSLKDQTMERQARRPIFWKLMDAIVNDGWGIKKTVWMPWLDFPLRREGQPDTEWNQDVTKFLEHKAAWPIAQRTVDPLTFFPRVGEYGGGDVIESGLRPFAPTLRALGLKLESSGRLISVPKDTPYPEWEVPAGASPTQRISELWNDEIMALVVGSDVFLFQNEQGRNPYTWRPGTTTALNDPALEGMSALYPTLTLQPWIDTLAGTMAGWALLAAIMPTYIEEQINMKRGATKEGPETSEIALGKVVKLPAGQTVHPGEAPAVGDALREMVGFLVGVVDRFNPPILQGQAPGRIAGVAAAGLREAALGRLTSLTDNSAELLAEEDAMVLYLIDEVVGAKVYAEGWEFDEASGKRPTGSRVGLSPRDINGRYSTLRQLNTDSLQDMIAKGTHGVFMSQGGIWSQERGMRFSGVDDPLQENIQKLQEFLFAQLGPQYAMQFAAQEEPTLGQLLQDFLGTDVGPQGGGQGGGNGASPGGNVPGPAPRRGGRPVGSPKGAGGGRRPVRQARGRMTPQ